MFIAKVSEESKSSSKWEKGLKFEAQASLFFHQADNVPILLSSLVLRDFGVGQVDLSFIENGVAVIVECKSSYRGLAQSQKHRLKNAAHLVGHLIKVPVVLRVLNESFCQKSHFLVT